MVVVERTGEDGSVVKLRTSPGNGKFRFESNLVQVGDDVGRSRNCSFSSLLKVTASLGEYSHFYVRSAPRTIHYNAIDNVFRLRCASHEVGFDQEGTLKIF